MIANGPLRAAVDGLGSPPADPADHVMDAECQERSTAEHQKPEGDIATDGEPRGIRLPRNVT
ncbi:MAG: hypothetical protein ACXVX0_00720 [Blastococcus sp.]